MKNGPKKSWFVGNILRFQQLNFPRCNIFNTGQDYAHIDNMESCCPRVEKEIPMLGAGDFKAGKQEIPTLGSWRFQRWGAGDFNAGEREISMAESGRFQ